MSKDFLKQMQEYLNQSEDDVLREERALFGGQELSKSPVYQEILRILEDNPILVQPTIRWLKMKLAYIQGYQMLALYSKEELKEMYTPEEWEVFKQRFNIQDD